MVIDVLRMTTTATEALAAGYEQVVCAADLDRARALRGPGVVLAGEQRCERPRGFDQGNSPREAAIVRGDRLVLATTNGAPAVVTAAMLADTVLLACLRNLDAVLSRLLAVGADADVQLVCAGTDGAPAIEDAYVAGRLCAALPGARSDAARIAEAVAAAQDARAALGAGANAAVLRRIGAWDDVAFCAAESQTDTVPTVVSWETGCATAVGARHAAGPGATRSAARWPDYASALNSDGSRRLGPAASSG